MDGLRVRLLKSGAMICMCFYYLFCKDARLGAKKLAIAMNRAYVDWYLMASFLDGDNNIIL